MNGATGEFGTVRHTVAMERALKLENVVRNVRENVRDRVQWKWIAMTAHALVRYFGSSFIKYSISIVFSDI